MAVPAERPTNVASNQLSNFQTMPKRTGTLQPYRRRRPAARSEKARGVSSWRATVDIGPWIKGVDRSRLSRLPSLPYVSRPARFDTLPSVPVRFDNRTKPLQTLGWHAWHGSAVPLARDAGRERSANIFSPTIFLPLLMLRFSAPFLHHFCTDFCTFPENAC